MSKKQIDTALLKEAAVLLAQKLNGKQYAIRGTASVVLQGYDMIAEDIDVLCDEQTSIACNKIFSDTLLNPIAFKENDKYKSYFGSFTINEVPVEIMGNWQIFNTKGEWSRVYNGSEFELIDIQGCNIRCTPLKLELEAFMQMGRWNAYHKLKNLLNAHVINDGNQLKLL